MAKQSGLMNEIECGICARVKQFREQIKWPQSGFAYELGITRDQLASIEYGRTPLRYEIGYRLCFMFDVNQEWLATGNGTVTPFTSSTSFPFPGEVPEKILFSEVHASLKKTSKLNSDVERETKAGAGREKRPEPKLIPDFDPSAYVMKRATEILTSGRFNSPLERQEFALEAGRILNVLRLKFRRKALIKQVRKSENLRNWVRLNKQNLSLYEPERAAKILKLREKIEFLEAEIAALEAQD